MKMHLRFKSACRNLLAELDLDSFVRERVTGPLKMNDTGFWVKPSLMAHGNWR